MTTVEWKDKSNPERVWLLKVRDIIIEGFGDSNSEAELRNWLAHDNGYGEKCRKRIEDPENYPGFTFTKFEDVYKYVKREKENVDAIWVQELNDGSVVINHGKHRLIAAKLLGVEYIKCRVRRRY